MGTFTEIVRQHLNGSKVTIHAAGKVNEHREVKLDSNEAFVLDRCPFGDEVKFDLDNGMKCFSLTLEGRRIIVNLKRFGNFGGTITTL